jgi:hypothetical protein
MLTIFALPKPFRGHIGIIQRNAVKSWTRLRPRPEIILFGDEEGTAEVAAELGVRHVADIQRNEFGTPLLSDLFKKAQDISSNRVLCYINGDIMMLGEFITAVEKVSAWRSRFLMVGQRTNLDIEQPLDFESPTWQKDLRDLVEQKGVDALPYSIDYFVFSRGLLPHFPAFAVGRAWWDNSFLWQARSSGAPLVDATDVVLAVHQNHDYRHIAQGLQGTLQGDEAQQNRKLALKLAGKLTGNRAFYTIADATHKLTPDGIRWEIKHFWAPTYGIRPEPRWRLPFVWSRDIRLRLGLTPAGLERLLAKMKIVKPKARPDPARRGGDLAVSDRGPWSK